MLVEVSIGEVFDKLSILTIKMDKIQDPIKRENVTKEYTSLKEALKGIDYPSQVNDMFEDLTHVNLALWDIEDRIRLKESLQQFDDEFVELARSVYRTNDRRFDIKRQINSILNSELVEEKQHIKYQ